MKLFDCAVGSDKRTKRELHTSPFLNYELKLLAMTFKEKNDRRKGAAGLETF